MKPIKRHRVGRILVLEFFENGERFVTVDGVRAGGTFHEAVVAARRAPLIAMRDQCREMAADCRKAMEEEA